MRVTAVLQHVDGVLARSPASSSDHRLIIELDGIPRADIVRALVLAEVRRDGDAETVLEDADPLARGARRDSWSSGPVKVRRIRTWACLALLGVVPIIVTVSSYVDPPRQ